MTTLPFTMSYILDIKGLKPFETIEGWMISGFAATKTLCERFEPLIPNATLWITYGLSETSIVSMNNTRDYTNIGVLNQNFVVKVSYLYFSGFSLCLDLMLILLHILSS